MANKFFDYNGLLYFWGKLKNYFVKQEEGKGLSSNDYTAEDKAKLAAIDPNANKYVLPEASNETLGGIKVGSGLSIDDGVLSTVPGKASSVDWDSIIGTPEEFPPEAHTHEASEVNGLHKVATSGKYADLIEVPDTFTPSKHEHTASEVTDLHDIATSGSWNDLEDIPEKFTPDTHTHTASEVSGLADVATSNDYEDLDNVPTDLGDFANAAGYQKAADVNGLIDAKGYKTETEIKSIVEEYEYQTSAQVEAAITQKGYQTASDVASAIAGASHLKRTIVTQLPSDNIDENTIYMVKLENGKERNSYAEFMYIENAWEQIGVSDVDLSGYVKEDDIAVISNQEIDSIVAA